MAIAWRLYIGWVSPLSVTNETTRLLSFVLEEGGDTELDDPRPSKCTLTLDNYDSRFNPWNTGSPLSPNVLPGKTVIVQLDTGSGFATAWWGYIQDLDLVSGGAEKRVVVTAYDSFYSKQNIFPNIAMQVGPTTVDELLGTTIHAVYGTRGTSPDVVRYFCNHGNKTTADLALELTRSDCGILAGNGWDTYVPRQYDTVLAEFDPRNEYTLAEADISDISINTPWSNIYNVITVNCQPYQKQAVAVLWTLFDASIYVPPGGSVEVWAPFTDTKGNEVAADDIVTPVATTDYTANAGVGGTGGDMTAYMSVDNTNYGVKSLLTISNTHASAGLYVTTLQIRGAPIATSNATVTVEDATSKALYGERRLTRDCPYIQSVSQATDYANALLYWYKEPTKEVTVRTVSYLPDGASWKPEDFVTVTAPTYQIDERMRIIHRRLEVSGPGLDAVSTVKMVSTYRREYWLLDDDVRGVLDTTTILGY